MEDDIKKALKTIRNILGQKKNLINYELADTNILNSLKIAEAIHIVSLSNPEIEYLLHHMETPSESLSDLFNKDRLSTKENTSTTINKEELPPAKITHFNYSLYRKYCKEYGVSPDYDDDSLVKKYTAALVINEAAGEIYIEVGENKYSLRHLVFEALTTRIITDAYNNGTTTIDKYSKDLVGRYQNFKQILSSNLYADDNSILKKFMDIKKKELTITKTIQITEKDLENIKKKATKGQILN